MLSSFKEREFFSYVNNGIFNVRVRNAEVEFIVLQRINFECFIFGREDNFLRSAFGINSKQKINLRADLRRFFYCQYRLLLFERGAADFVGVVVDM